jgi:hypothetical protein
MSREQFASGKDSNHAGFRFRFRLCGALVENQFAFQSADDKVSSVQVLLLARRRRQNSRFRRLHYISLSLRQRPELLYYKYED